jgi:hypothetical protein
VLKKVAGSRRSLICAPLLLLLASPAWAVKEWYDHYLDARDKLVPAGRCEEAARSLREAIRLKPKPAVNVQTYGLQFENYLPYYYLGVCALKSEDFNTAIRMFNIEEDKGAIKEVALYKELRRLRTEAENAERQRVAREQRNEVQRLLKEASDLGAGRKFDEALARLVEAQVAAQGLDRATQQQVLDARNRVLAEQKRLVDAEQRSRRIELELSEGGRLLESGKPAEAIGRFDQVLALDPANRRALDGRKDAQERILASKTRQALEDAFQQGKALFESGKHEEAVGPLTVAAADPANAGAQDLLGRTRKILEGQRLQRELRRQIEGLLAEAEQLIALRKFPEAQVRLESLLRLDAGNPRAKERLAHAERMTGEALFEKWMPNREPAITIVEPRANEAGETDVEGSRVAIVGVATDDRGISKVEFHIGGRLMAQVSPPRLLDSGEFDRDFAFDQQFLLEPGLNDVTVTATDTSGARKAEAFRLRRRLRFYETAAFLPSALATAVGLIGAGLGVQRVRRRRAVRNRFNPYIAGAPVMDDDMFFGRDKLMARMMNVLHSNSLMITGERRIGKTTFLYHLKKALESDDAPEYRFFPVFTDLQGVLESDFFHAVMTDVVDTLGLSAQTLASLRFRPEGDHYDGRDFSHDLQRVIEELKTRTSKRVKLALLIDEVDVLNEFSERINQRLRSIFMKTFSEHLVAIMSGVGIKRTWKSEGSPWYNFFDEIELTALDREEAAALVRTPVEGFFRYEPEAVEAILGYSELKPYLIQKFCIQAVNRILEARRTTVTAADVEAVRDAVQFEGRAAEVEPAALGREVSV